MREIGAELKALKLYGMASAWSELSVKGKDVGTILAEVLGGTPAMPAVQALRAKFAGALSATEETSSAATNSITVATLSRRGVSHVR